MKILYLKDSFDPSYEMRDELQFILQARKHGHSVTIVTSNYNLDNREDSVNLSIKDKNYDPDFEIIRRAGFKIPSKYFIFNLTPWLKLLRGKYNIFFVHNLGSYSSFLSPIIKFFTDSRIILKADFGEIPYNRAKRSWLYNKLISLPTYSPDVILCFTKLEKDLLVKLGVPEEKVTLIPVGIDYANTPDLTKEPGSGKGKCTVGLMGRLVEQKGHHTIIGPVKKMLNEYPQAKFITAGPRSNKTYAKSFLDAFDNHDRFEYKGVVGSIYNDFFKYCDIVLIPSLWESGSIVCLEAMACGKTVIASDINPHYEYIEDGESGFLVKQPEEYYTICKKLMEKPTEIRRIGKNARIKVKKYDWNSIGNDVEKLYSGN